MNLLLFLLIRGVVDWKSSNVVALVSNHRAVCTGVLLSPTTVLTAGHCALNRTAPLDAVVAGVSVTAEFMTASIQQIRVPPSLHFAADGDIRSDLALLEIWPALPWQPGPQLSANASLPRWLKLTGYGSDEFGNYGVRKSGTVSVVAISDTTISVQPGPELNCSGDSGAPAYASIDGTEHLVGVVSVGDTGCSSYGRYVNLATYAAWLQSPSADQSERLSNGSTCKYDGQCTSLFCIQQRCSKICATLDDCQNNETCVSVERGGLACVLKEWNVIQAATTAVETGMSITAACASWLMPVVLGDQPFSMDRDVPQD